MRLLGQTHYFYENIEWSITVFLLFSRIKHDLIYKEQYMIILRWFLLILNSELFE